MISSKLKKALPHLIAIIIFLGISSIFFYPQLEGYRLFQHDNTTSIGMSKECRDYRDIYNSEPLWTNSMFSGMPAYQISVRNTNLLNTLKNFVLKIIPRPIGYMFLLMIGFYIFLLCLNVRPELAAIGAIAFGLSSYNILYMASGHNSKIHAISFIPPLLGGIVYGYKRNFLIGSAIVAIFVCLHITANHLQMTYYMLYLVLAIVIVQLIKYIKKKKLIRFLKVSAFLLLGACLGILPPVANILVTKEYSKYTTRGESELTIQNPNNTSSISKTALDSDYIKRYSLGISEVWSLVIPNVKGGSMGYLGQEKEHLKNVNPNLKKQIAQFPKYWGEQYATGGAFYFGASLFILFILGAFFVKDKLKWSFIAVSMLAVFLSWKYGWLTDFFIENVPLFNKFRDTKMMLFLVQISFALLGMLFIQHLFSNTINHKKFLYVSLSVTGILFLFYLMPNVWFDFFSKNELRYFNELKQNYRLNHNAIAQISEMQNDITSIRHIIFKKDCLRSIFFIIITSTAVYLFVKHKIKKVYFIFLLGSIVLFDLWGVDKRYLNNKKQASKYKQWVNKYEYVNPFKATIADKAILESEITKNKELEDKIQRAIFEQKVSGEFKASEINNEKDKIRFRELNFNTNYRVLFLADPFNESRTSYFHKSIGGYHGAKLKTYQELIEFYISDEISGLIKVLQNGASQDQIDSVLKNEFAILNMLNTKYLIYNTDREPIRNRYNYGNAWFVKKLNFVSNANEEMISLKDVTRNKAIVQTKYTKFLPSDILYDSLASIDLIKYLPNHLIYKSKTNSNQVALFSEVFYEAGWNAYINGKHADYFKANYLLRGLSIPEGENTIEFRFEPKTYYLGRKISKIGSILILCYILGVLVYQVITNRRARKISNNL